MSFSFQKWLIQEKADIFGFERELRPQKKNIQDSQPINSFDIEKIIQFLASHNIGQLQPEIVYVNEVHWSQGPEAVRVLINNWLNVQIERRVTDLCGEYKWVTKKVYQLNHNQYGGMEDAVSHEILQEVERVHNNRPDSPMQKYEDFENLVSTVAGAIRRNANDIFFFGGIRRINENNYVIRMNLRGHGIQRKGQKRVEENHTQMTFDPRIGLVRLTNYNIESPLGEHKWEITQTDIDWNFAPTQTKDEISRAISTTMHWY